MHTTEHDVLRQVMTQPRRLAHSKGLQSQGMTLRQHVRKEEVESSCCQQEWHLFGIDPRKRET